MKNHTVEEIKAEVESFVNQTVGTIYGPSLVVGVVEDDKGNLFVHLKEFGEEDYHIRLDQWHSVLQ